MNPTQLLQAVNEEEIMEVLYALQKTNDVRNERDGRANDDGYYFFFVRLPRRPRVISGDGYRKPHRTTVLMTHHNMCRRKSST